MWNCFFDLTNCINEAIRNNKFPDSLKLSDITPVFKKLDPSDKANYRPVSVLPLLSKVFEKNYLWPALWIFRKLSELVVVWFAKRTFHATCSLQANSEMADRAWLRWLCSYNFNGFV